MAPAVAPPLPRAAHPGSEAAGWDETSRIDRPAPGSSGARWQYSVIIRPNGETGSARARFVSGRIRVQAGGLPGYRGEGAQSRGRAGSAESLGSQTRAPRPANPGESATRDPRSATPRDPGCLSGLPCPGHSTQYIV